MRIRQHGKVFASPAEPKRSRYLNPRGKKYGVRSIDIPCPSCEAAAGDECMVIVGPNVGNITAPHPSRLRMAQRKRNQIAEEQANG